MSITSLTFVGFVVLTILLYYWLPKRFQNTLLLVASYVFLASWAVQFAVSFALLTLINYFISLRLSPSQKHRSIYLWIGILANIVALVYFKYDNFFVPYIVYYLKRSGLVVSAETLKFILPIGLSFYVVQAISYLMDIYRGIFPSTTNLLNFAVFMAYFPRLISGPIERARDYLPQLEKYRPFSMDNIWRGFTLILVGLVRKIALADVMTLVFPNNVFTEPDKFSAPALTLWLVAYALMIYNDFAGYTSIIRGVSSLFGINLISNFNAPYLSRNFTEFWQRWHISLSNWLRDYIFTPLTRSLLRRKFNSRHPLTIIAPPLVTMLASALWHGVAWNMLLWGILHGIYQVVERSLSIIRHSPPVQQKPGWKQLLYMPITFILVLIAWVPFHMEISLSLSYWRGLLQYQQWANAQEVALLLNRFSFITLFVITISFFIDILQYKYGELMFLKLSPFTKALLINGAIILIILGFAAQVEAPPPFIYQGF